MNQKTDNIENNINFSNELQFSEKNKKISSFIKDSNNFTFTKYGTSQKNFNNDTSNFLLNNNSNNNTLLNKKRKYMTSEELELEQIEKERKEVREMIRKNMALYYKMNNIQTAKIIPNQTTKIITESSINNNKVNVSVVNNNNYFNKFEKNKQKLNSYVNIFKQNEINQISIKNKNNEGNENKAKTILELINTDIEPVKFEKKEEKVNEGKTKEEKISEEKINEEKVKEENIEDNFEEKNDECISLNENICEEKKSNKKGKKNKKQIDQEVEGVNSTSPYKTPDKENLYLKKMKELGSLSKLSLCNKIQKYTEICQEVLKQQESKKKTK